MKIEVWLAACAALAVTVIFISFPPRSATDSLSRNRPAKTTMTTQAVGRDAALTQRLPAQRGQQPPSPAEYVYQGRTLNERVGDLYSTNRSIAQAAFDAFRAMGPDASPAIPLLAEILY